MLIVLKLKKELKYHIVMIFKVWETKTLSKESNEKTKKMFTIKKILIGKMICYWEKGEMTTNL
jgi:hypothetical protein